MTLQTTLRKSLPVLLVFTFLISPLTSYETTNARNEQTFSTHSPVNAESSMDHPVRLDLTLPAGSKKEKEKDYHGSDLVRHKRHADEDRHDNHHHHFDKVKHRKKIVNILSALILKIFIVISYFSILLCSYMSLVNH